jgi:ABC-type Fe3+/spermidine/putrescine transport system ATPase subunit
VRDALALVEIGDVDEMARRRPTALSGGQQQRVALARRWSWSPACSCSTSRSVNLDAKVRQRLRVEVRRLQRRVGITAIHVTHDQEEALAIADRVVLMDAGRVVQSGTPEDVYFHPASEFAADFLGVGNSLAAAPSRVRSSSADQRARVDRRPRAARDRDHPVLGSHARPAAAGRALRGVLEESMFLGRATGTTFASATRS